MTSVDRGAGGQIPYRIPSRWTYLQGLDRKAFVAHDPSKGGVHLLSKPAAEQVQLLLSRAVPTNGRVIEALCRKGKFLEPCEENSPERKGKTKYNSLSVWFSLTQGCNLGCHHCYIPSLQKLRSPNTTQVVPPIEAVSRLRALAIAAKEAGYNRLAVRLTGGEPLLAADSIRGLLKQKHIIEDEFDLRVSFWLLTNATLVTPEVAEILTEAHCGASVSIDGDEEEHNKIRYFRDGNAVRGSWKGV